MLRYGFFLLILLSRLADAVPSATAASIVQPDFAIKITLGNAAKRYLSAHSESLSVSVSFADEIGPGGNYLANIHREAQGEATIAIRNIKFDPKKVRKLGVADYEVLVNVASGRRSSDKNVLECGFLQAPISKLQHGTHAVHCELGSQASAHGGRPN